MNDAPAYGLWSLVIINSLVFIIFVFSGWLSSRFPGVYVLLAKREERDAEAEFGDEYRRYVAGTPAFFPRWGQSRAPAFR